MQYCSFRRKGQSSAIFPGRVAGNTVERLDVPTMIDVILREGTVNAIETLQMSEIEFAAPIPNPSKIVCVGLNYKEHIAEFGHPTPTEPVIFSKPSSAIIGPNDAILLPKASAHIDYEGEVAIVIGKTAKSIDDAAPYIFGYTCFNDVTARDIQRKSSDWTRAKGFDTFAPMGPTINTARPSWLRTYLNGKQVQKTSTGDMLFGFEQLIRNISRVMTLRPGDIIATGTPSGVGKLKPSDNVGVEAEGIGLLENTVSE